MIIIKCDLCGKQQGNMNTVILYKRKLDYCSDCAKEVNVLKKKFEEEIETLKKQYDNTLRKKEKMIIEGYIR